MDQIQTPEGIATAAGEFTGGLAGGIAGAKLKPKLYAKVKDVPSGSSVVDDVAPNGTSRVDEMTPKGTGGTDDVVDVSLSKSKYPESAQHIEDAIKNGQPDTLTINRDGATANRRASLKGIDKVPGADLDEFPPAMFNEGGSGSSVRPISPSDNRGAGSTIGHQLRPYPDGTKVKINITE